VSRVAGVRADREGSHLGSQTPALEHPVTGGAVVGMKGTLGSGLHQPARRRGLFTGHRTGTSQKLCFLPTSKLLLLSTETHFEIN